MKNILMILLAIGLFQGATVFAQDGFGGKHGRNRDDGGGNSSGGDRMGNSGNGGENQKVEKPVKEQAKPHQARTQKQNHTNRNFNSNTGSGLNLKGNHQNQGFNRNLNSQNQNTNRPQNQGVYGKKNRDNNRNDSQKSQGGDRTFNDRNPNGGNDNRAHGGGVNRDRVVAVPPKFQKMGIKSVPEPIHDRSHLLTDDRRHSVISFPKSGPEGRSLNAHTFTPRAMNGKIVQNHMTTITNNTTFNSQINVYNTTETRANNYYWHSYNGNNYCHYYDNWGYHWYGWYIGSNCFWTRYYSNNWWWYDSGYSRWCYWHDGGWWWQDPYHVNVVYVYNNGNYTSVNAQAQAANNDSNQVIYQSNDGTRKVKVMGEGRDAFLYDTSDHPSFNPVYLASGVQEVKFSNTSNNRPLQIVLTLKDGSFDMFDANGNSYNGGGNNFSNNNDDQNPSN